MKTVSTSSVRAAHLQKTPVKASKWPLLIAFLALGGAGFGLLRSRSAPVAQNVPQTTAPIYAQKLGWKVSAIQPHDPQAFTQGLVWHEGGFYQGTGMKGKSQLRRVEFPSG